MDVKGSVAFVTGANRGIGRAIVDELLNRGAAKVYAGVRDPSSVRRAGVEAVAVDVTNPDQVKRAVESAPDVNLLINNAGIARPGTGLDATLENARAEIETNYLALLTTTQAFAPVLAANGGGAIVNVLSVVSWMGVPTLATYSASKSAAWGYTNAARTVLGLQGTDVVGVRSATSTPSSPPASRTRRSPLRQSRQRRSTPCKPGCLRSSSTSGPER